MCNLKMMPSTRVAGPATEALERATKRPRTSSHKVVDVEPDLPCLHDLFETVDPTDISFPSISWESDNETEAEEEFCFLRSLLAVGNKRSRNGMVRSKTFKTDLLFLGGCSQGGFSLPRNVSVKPLRVGKDSCSAKVCSHGSSALRTLDQLPLFDLGRSLCREHDEPLDSPKILRYPAFPASTHLKAEEARAK